MAFDRTAMETSLRAKGVQQPALTELLDEAEALAESAAKTAADAAAAAARTTKADRFAAMFGAPAQQVARDPVSVLKDIFKDDALSDEYKLLLMRTSDERFKNRRKMAYISLYMIIASVTFLGAAILIDFFAGPTVLLNASGDPIMVGGQPAVAQTLSALIAENTTIIGLVEGFFTTIVAAYYGAASLRPTS